MKLESFKEFFNRKRSIAYICALLSAYTLVAFHYPFFSYVAENVSHDFSGFWLIGSLVVIMLALNYMIYYLFLYIGRVIGKWIIALSLVANAFCFYFICTYNALIDRSMMGNFYNTQYSEASSFFSWGMLCYALFLGVLPAILLLRKSVDYSSIGKFLRNFGLSLLVIIGIVGSNYKNTFWIDRHAPVIGSKLMPWSYTINSFRHFSHQRKTNQKEIILPDAEMATDSKDICILIIGESARSQNFSLYGYERNTNPLLTADGVTALKAVASHTNTTGAVKALLQHKPSRTLYEILPNYLSRNGVDVVWRSSNWGTPPIHIEKKFSKGQLKKLYPEADSSYDGILFHNLKEHIVASDNKIFIGIHTYTSHGPEYYSNTPEEFKVFLPECKTVEMADAKYEELINAYDNTIVYTDHLVHSVIDMLKREFPDRRSCVIFVSDHGESLGEGGLYMHGVPLATAPAEQLDIPFIVWTSECANTKVKEIESASHYHIYHSVLKFLGMQTPFFDESKNIFE